MLNMVDSSKVELALRTIIKSYFYLLETQAINMVIETDGQRNTVYFCILVKANMVIWSLCGAIRPFAIIWPMDEIYICSRIWEKDK